MQKKIINSTIGLSSIILFFFTSCIYSAPQNQNEIEPNIRLICVLDSMVNETSSLILVNNCILTNNDRGGEAAIYQIDSVSGKAFRKFIINDNPNTDWEELTTAKDGRIFIGDFGNNRGTRKDLKILYFNSHNYANKDAQAVAINKTNTIAFNYPSQKSFEKSKNHRFNCEAFLHMGNKLYLFSKNQEDEDTDLYWLPDTVGNYAANYITTFNSLGLITGATMNNDATKIVLVGYNKKDDVFLWILEDFKPDNLFSGKNQKIYLGQFNEFGQAEGICYLEKGKVLISVEKTKSKPPRLYLVSHPDL